MAGWKTPYFFNRKLHLQMVDLPLPCLLSGGTFWTLDKLSFFFHAEKIDKYIIQVFGCFSNQRKAATFRSPTHDNFTPTKKIPVGDLSFPQLSLSSPATPPILTVLTTSKQRGLGRKIAPGNGTLSRHFAWHALGTFHRSLGIPKTHHAVRLQGCLQLGGSGFNIWYLGWGGDYGPWKLVG